MISNGDTLSRESVSVDTWDRFKWHLYERFCLVVETVYEKKL